MKVAVLLSGGVDSAVALKLLQKEGHLVEAFYLKIWLEEDEEFAHECPWQEDLSYVTAVTDYLHVPLTVVPMQKQYYEKIVDYTVSQAKQGNTPNPDVFCNTYIKFGAFFDLLGHTYDRIATGHYAQRIDTSDGVYLATSADTIKDQTYFLSYISKKQLQTALFPIGGYTKKEVRELAAQFGLPNSLRKDSQGLCFLGKIKFKDFLRHHLGVQKGVFIDFETGKVVGTHEGAWFYTSGQRQGIGLPAGPWYVVSKDIENHTVVISRDYKNLTSRRKNFFAAHCRWISEQVPKDGFFKIKLRHGPTYHSAAVTFTDDKAYVCLYDPDQGIAPGQFAVFYQDTICLGGGIIQP